MTGIEDLDVFLGLDYSQLEVRVAAEMSGDTLLIKQLREAGYDSQKAKATGKDIHCQVGVTLTGWPWKKIANDKETRRTVKEFHFEIIFGGSKDSLYSHLVAKGVKITKAQTSQFTERYFRKYPGVRRFHEKQRRQGERDGYVETLFGFRRPIEVNDERRGTYWGNQVINTPIQGTAHQFILMALSLLYVKPKTYNLLQRPVMEVHDALYFRVTTKHLAPAYKQAMQLLQHTVVAYAARLFHYKMRIPMVAEASAGYCLGSMVEYAGEPVSRFLESWREKHKKAEAEGWEKLFKAETA